MIDNQFNGLALKDIPYENFKAGFDPAGRFPALILASTRHVPASTSSAWHLASEESGGYENHVLMAAVLPLSVRPDMEITLTQISSKEFTSQSLDYLELMNEESVRLIHEGYQAFINERGLTCNQENMRHLTQAIYPLDATLENLTNLTTDNIVLLGMQQENGLVLFIVGQNRD